MLLPVALLEQTGMGNIQGTVKDGSGGAVPKAKVTLEGIDTGTQFNTETNHAGIFLFPSVQPGNYRLSGEAPGLEKWEGKLELMAGQEASIDLVLKIGHTSTQVHVAGDVTPLLTTTGPTLSTTVERARIEELPLNGRLIEDLMPLMTPGLEPGVGSIYGGIGNTSPQPYGLRDGSVQFVQDGVSIDDANLSQITSRPPGMDTIEEFRTPE